MICGGSGGVLDGASGTRAQGGGFPKSKEEFVETYYREMVPPSGTACPSPAAVGCCPGRLMLQSRGSGMRMWVCSERHRGCRYTWWPPEPVLRTAVR